MSYRLDPLIFAAGRGQCIAMQYSQNSYYCIIIEMNGILCILHRRCQSNLLDFKLYF